ncbi:glucokinase [Chitinophaga costaii]|uniref:Glucokinase n=1 Tax=Chitinophaga costaii TaxID=1335309 RepID=A0A1C4G5W2_9BACT|nr:glucokinase [Chitinophaga costaii]PUZ20109.1 glucokinase [Chitinophaga costaii]SCC63524.1 glucokinase [Chitinophaga costaii]
MAIDNQAKYLPVFSRLAGEQASKAFYVLAGDLGGTKTNLALYEVNGASLRVLEQATYHSNQYNSLSQLIKTFHDQYPDRLPDRISVGVAGPVLHGKAAITNLTMEISEQAIAEATGVKNVYLLNDLEATAYGLATLQGNDLVTLHPGDPSMKGNMAIIAPGTGLGEAGLFYDGEIYFPFATEGGHSDFAPRSAQDMAIHNYLHQKVPVVSWEHLVSGMGILNIFNYLKDVEKMEVPDWMTASFNTKDDAAVISTAAEENKAPIATQTMALFVKYLARETSSLMLKLKATGGVFLGGGIPPKILPLLQSPAFYQHYRDGDRLFALLETAPLHVIDNDKTALQGAAFYGAQAQPKV